MEKIKSLLLLFVVFISSMSFSYECEPKRIKVELPKEIKSLNRIAQIAEANFKHSDFKFETDVRKISARDRRKARSASSPKYLNAVGKLSVVLTINGKNFLSICSANLVAKKEKTPSKILTSASHCFHKKGATVKKITWNTYDQNNEVIEYSAKLLKSEVSSDTALLSLNSPVPFAKVKPLLLIEGLKYEDETTGDLLDMYGSTATAAGYSSDVIKGNNGKILTYTEDLEFDDIEIARDSYGRKVERVEAVSYGGASGGALILRLNSEFRSDLDLDENNDQEVFMGILANVQAQSIHRDTLYSSNGVHGSPQTNVIQMDRFLEEDYFSTFE